MIFFGTDGIRGITGNELDFKTCYNLGRSLLDLKPNAKILIGKDTRQSGDFILHSIVSGALSNGGKVVDIGILTTPGISFLTEFKNFDYGISITASHNPKEYNGIKIFKNDGTKLTIKEEENIKNLMMNPTNNFRYGTYNKNVSIKEYYFKFLRKVCGDFSNISILIDCANGASCSFIKEVMSNTGAKCFYINHIPNGSNINEKSGILNYDLLLKRKQEFGTDYAFSLDGDGDRILIIDKFDNILDGDKILYLLCSFYKNTYNIKTAVGTIQTNKGIEKSLNSLGINLIRTEVGDKNVCAEMQKLRVPFGSEQTGHVVCLEYQKSGDGLLVANLVISVIEKMIQSNTYKSTFEKMITYPQSTLNYKTTNKNEIIEKVELKEFIEKLNTNTSPKIYTLVRPSGTENKIRIQVESLNKKICDTISKDIYDFIEKLDKLIENEKNKI